MTEDITSSLLIIVHGNDRASKTLETVLTDFGYRNVSQTDDVDAALAKLKERSFISMVILDGELVLRKMNPLAKAITDNKEIQQPIIVGLTKKLTDEAKKDIRAMGVSLCHQKPFRINILQKEFKALMTEKVDDALRIMEEQVDSIKKLVLETEEEQEKTSIVYLKTINLLKDAREIYPWLTYPYQKLAMVYQKIGFFDDVLKSYATVLKIKPEDREAYLGIARLLFKRKQWNRLIKTLTPFVARVHSSTIAGILGEAYLMLNDTDNAIKSFSNSIQYGTDKTEKRNMAQNFDGLGKSYQNKYHETQDRKWLNEAIDSFHSAIQFDPVSISAHINLYCSYKKIGNKEKAAQLLQNIAGIIPERSGDWIDLGKQFLEEENRSKAAFSFRRALEKSNELPQTYFEIGDAYAEKEPDLALKFLNKSLELDKKQPHVLNKRGILYRKKGLTPVAIRNYTEALKIDPEDERIHYNLALALLENHDLQSRIKAVEHLKKAIELRENFNEAETLLKKISE